MSGREADLFSEVSSDHSNWLSGNAGRICASRPNMPFRASCVGLVASLPISARKNAGISLAMRLCSNVTGIHSRSTSR
jgi:hypothetical protein